MGIGKRRLRQLAALSALLLIACDKPAPPTDSDADAQLAGDLGTGPQIPFDDAEVFFEFNTTDNDLGLQIFLDAEGWKTVRVADPDRGEIVQITAEGNLSRLGITELRFESAEPSPAEVLALFPPGRYEFLGRTVAGARLRSKATLSHDFLPAPTFSPADGQAVEPNNTIVTWSAPGAERVEVILEHEASGDVFDVTVAGSVTSLNVPPQFLRRGTEYKIEILAVAENGNRTIGESTFVTMP